MKKEANKMNEYFNLIEDEDLESDEQYKYNAWIWYCPECSALFGSKAIHNRTIFRWFGYHPNDGNCKVITDETAMAIAIRADACHCKPRIRRVHDAVKLKSLVEYNKENSLR